MSKRGNKPKFYRKKVIKWQSLAIWFGIIAVLVSTLYGAWNSSNPLETTMTYNEFMSNVEDGNVVSVKLVESQKTFTATMDNGEKFTIINPDYEDFKKDILTAGVAVEIQKVTALEAVSTAITTLPMLILLFVILWFFIKSFGSQTTTLYKVYKAEEAVTFDRVAGMSEAKEEVQFAVSQIKNAKRLKELGAKPCKGILLEGPPGTGKTLLAKAIAGEAGVPFISTNGSDFIEMFVGLGAARVRALWEMAELNAPCVLFIDEIDAVGKRRRGAGDSATADANQTLNELLGRMDGLSTTSGVFVVAATNRAEDLDPALVRPGRFDKKIFIGPPKTKKDRDEIVRLYLKNKKISEGTNFDDISRLTFGLSGAEIEQILNESVLVSLQHGRDGIISIEDVDEAAMKLRTSGVAVGQSSEEDREIAAVHEAGHAVVGALLGRKASKVSIRAYNSGVGGLTIRDTDDVENKKILTKTEITDEIKVLLAGRMAEQVLLGSSSAGCSNDIERATQLAYNMLYRFAMNDDYLINPDTLAKLDTNILDTGERVNNVNETLLVINSTVRDLVSNNVDKIRDLADRLKTEEDVYNYSI